MVLAEVVAQGGLFDIAELDEPALRPDTPLLFKGEGLSEGVAVGRVVLHEPRVKVERMIADNPAAELKRLEDAIAMLRESVDLMLDSSELDLTGEGREVIEAYRLFAYDQGWRQRMRDAIHTGLTAEAAVERVQDETRLRVTRLNDPILRERAHDLDDFGRRLLRHLTGEGEARASKSRRTPSRRARDGARGACRLWARPSARAGGGRRRNDFACRHRCAFDGIAAGRFRRRHYRCRAQRATRLLSMARTAKCICARLPEIVAAFETKRELRAIAQARFAQIRDLPAVTKDGVPIRLMMNAGLLLDMPHLQESGADGVGLFRTELQFMIGETMPRLADQISFYSQVSKRRATNRSCSARSILAATRCFPMRAGSGRKIPRSAGALSASRSIVRRCCVIRCARC